MSFARAAVGVMSAALSAPTSGNHVPAAYLYLTAPPITCVQFTITTPFAFTCASARYAAPRGELSGSPEGKLPAPYDSKISPLIPFSAHALIIEAISPELVPAESSDWSQAGNALN